MGRSEEVGVSTTELESSGVWSQGPGCLGALAVSRCLSKCAMLWTGDAARRGPGNSNVGRDFPSIPAW